MHTTASSDAGRQIEPLRFARKFGSGIVLWAFLLVMVVFTVFPVLMTLFGSFKSNLELMTGASILPSEWHFSNYVEAWKQANFSRYTWNSLFVSVAATTCNLTVAAMAAYAVDRRSFPLKKIYVSLIASTMFISVGAIVLRPQFELMVALNLHSTLWGVVLVMTAGHATTFFILLGFFKSIPRDLDEAAFIDGCSFFGIFWRVVLPLLRPGLAVAALFEFRAAWNDYILPLVFTMTKPELQTLTVGLANLRYGSSAAMQTHLMMAGACLSILPILIVYMFANRSFMQLTAGSLKG